MDVPAQEAATAAIDAAFRAAEPGPARLLIAGPAVFARDAARAIKGDVRAHLGAVDRADRRCCSGGGSARRW